MNTKHILLNSVNILNCVWDHTYGCVYLAVLCQRFLIPRFTQVYSPLSLPPPLYSLSLPPSL